MQRACERLGSAFEEVRVAAELKWLPCRSRASAIGVLVGLFIRAPSEAAKYAVVCCRSFSFHTEQMAVVTKATRPGIKVELRC